MPADVPPPGTAAARPPRLFGRVWTSALAVLLSLAGLALSWLAQGDHPFTLSQDDAFVHMEVARNLVEHGVWGMDPGAPTGASSSPMWVLLLALVELLGLGDGPQVAVVLAGASTMLVLLIADRWLVEKGWSTPARLSGMMVVAVAGRSVALVPTGLEHALQAALFLKCLQLTGSRRGGGLWSLLLLLALLPIVRPEGGLALVVLFVTALATRTDRVAIAAFGGALVAGGAVVFLQTLFGGQVLPETVPDMAIVRAVRSTGVGHALWGRLQDNVSGSPALLVQVVMLSTLIVARRWDGRSTSNLASLALLSAAQLLVGRVGELYRYEAWLLTAGAVVGLLEIKQSSGANHGPARRTAFAAASAMVCLSILAGLNPMRQAWEGVPRQGAVLGATGAALGGLDLYGPIAVVSAGEVVWRSGKQIVDISCRTTHEVNELCRRGDYTPDDLDAIVRSHGVALAVVPLEWWEGALVPNEWEPLEVWTFEAAPQFGGFIFLSVDPARREALQSDLRMLTVHPGIHRTRSQAAWTVFEGGGEAHSHEVFFFGNGKATTIAASSGLLVIHARGTTADGRGPRFEVERTGAAPSALEAGPTESEHEIGVVHAGDVITLIYNDDLVDQAGNDRNLWVKSPEVR